MSCLGRVAIVGAAGMLGRTFRQLLEERGDAFDAFDAELKCASPSVGRSPRAR